MNLCSPNPRRYCIFSFSLLFLLAAFSSSYAQDFTLTPTETRVQVGKSKSVEVTVQSGLLAVESVAFDAPTGVTVTSVKGANDQTVLLTIALSQPGNFSISVKVGAVSKTIMVRPIIQSDNLPFQTALPETLELRRNDPTRTYLVKDGLKLQASDLKITSTNERVSANFDGTRLTISPAERGEAQVTISNSDNVLLKTITVTVKESSKNVRPDPLEISIDKDDAAVDWFSKIKLIGLGGADVTADLKNDITLESSDGQLLDVDSTTRKLKGLKKGDPRLTLRSAADGIPIGVVVVHVTVKPKDIAFSSDTGSFILKPNQTIRVTATLKNGTDISDERVTKWDYANEESKALISFADFGTSTISVTALPSATSGTATLKAVYGQDNRQANVTFTVQVTNVTEFQPLQVRFDVLDDQTARDLFGKKAADDFHIAKIRLFNKLRDPSNLGNSILVYGESLEVNVALEIKRDNGKWETLEKAEYNDYFDNTNPNPPYSVLARVPGQPTTPSVQPGVPGSTEEDGPKACRRTPQPNFIARYRPMTFEMIANTHDRRDERSVRSRILLIMNSASSLTSFVTSIAVPGPSSDLPIGLDKFQNLLIPSFEKLFPTMREVQRQNIVSMVMRPLEEVPFGSDITRIVFFPKKPIRGILPSKFLRIGAISVSDSCAEVGIIKKAGQP